MSSSSAFGKRSPNRRPPATGRGTHPAPVPRKHPGAHPASTPSCQPEPEDGSEDIVKPSDRKRIALLPLVLFLSAALVPLEGAVGLRPASAQEETPEAVDDWEEEDWDTGDEAPAQLVADPIQPFNKAMFVFNDRLYFWVLKPVAQGYAYVVPQTVRRGVSNFFYNLAAPIRIVNSALQGKGNRMGIEIGRFCINVLEGGLGFGNAADNYPELATSPEDAGQTLGHYGVGDGFYIVWPLLGPSTLRDTVGRFGDWFLDPLTYLDPMELRLGLRVYDRVNAVSLRIGDYEALKAAALSPYDALKDAYVQNRRRLVLE